MVLSHFLLFPAASLIVVRVLSISNFSSQTEIEVLLMGHFS